MKIFTKLYIGIMAVLITALLVSGFFVVRVSYNKSISHEVEHGMAGYNMFLSAFRTNFIIASRSGLPGKEQIERAVKAAEGGNSFDVKVVREDGEILYNTLAFEPKITDASTDQVRYYTEHTDESTCLVYYSQLEQRGKTYNLITATDISYIIRESNSLRRNFFLIYGAILVAGTIFALIFSARITKPLASLSEASRAMSEGDYSRRIDHTANDELGVLSDSYNRMAETIEEKVDQLELSVKQKEDFVAAFSHEMKTPMTSIIGYADLIYQGKLPESEVRDAAGIIMNEGMRLEALAFKLLQLSSLDQNELTREEVSIEDMTEDLRLSMEPKAREKQITIDYDLTPGYLRIDYDLFKTAIMNLIDNALKSGTDAVEVTGRAEEGYILSVIDHGRGIVPDDLNRVKEAFYMVDKSRSRKEHGAGLGLSLCERIVEAHGGELTIESTPEVGTAVQIWLKDYID
ncbi:MAG: HAMP domain-containing histidine kinase [Eubacterium sp.]|nr:HAMP domain-containing histidine kinase [Eubacterium sp.]